ncbi:WD repeat-containing protein 75-like [Pollicipes pollicipes]|uniref:WD repeat-containing protein 75-like n=1 Tax=Pollicipes pollicipes TaxID=41117 RepID=UPI001884FBC2|nr:WD repeat-containing protein 75-like [Pollicipes pollicipes]
MEVAFGGDGRMVAALVKADTILVRNLWQKESAKTHQYNTLRSDSARPFTCLACHRTEPAVAAGDASGRLLLWRRLLADAPPVRSVLHWHTLPLPSVSFSPEGTYLVSGGEECVLVYWHGQDEQPAFLPRLGMPIRHVTVSPDNQLVATSHADNVIRLVSAQRQVTQLIRGLSWGASAGPATGLVLEPRCGALLLNGAVGHLQLFSPHDRRDLYSVTLPTDHLASHTRTYADETGAKHIRNSDPAFLSDAASHCCISDAASHCCISDAASHCCISDAASHCCISDAASHCCISDAASHCCISHASGAAAAEYRRKADIRLRGG